MTIRPLDAYPVGNMVNPVVEARRQREWEQAMAPLGDVLKDLGARTIPARKVTLEPEWDHEPANVD